MIGIYKITSPTGKVYIGQSWNVFERWKDHKGTGERRFENRVLVSSIRKYGYDNHSFEILYSFQNLNRKRQDILDEYEKFYIAIYRLMGIPLMNMTDGGQGKRGYKVSDETRQKLSQQSTGKKRQPLSAETKLKISIAHKGKSKPSPTAETIAKRSAKLKGRIISEDHRKKISIAKLGKEFSETHKKNLSLNWRKNKKMHNV
jgi:group I intron endonuclease